MEESKRYFKNFNKEEGPEKGRRNRKMQLKEIDINMGNRFDLTQDRDYWRALQTRYWTPGIHKPCSEGLLNISDVAFVTYTDSCDKVNIWNRIRDGSGTCGAKALDKIEITGELCECCIEPPASINPVVKVFAVYHMWPLSHIPTAVLKWISYIALETEGDSQILNTWAEALDESDWLNSLVSISAWYLYNTQWHGLPFYLNVSSVPSHAFSRRIINK